MICPNPNPPTNNHTQPDTHRRRHRKPAKPHRSRQSIPPADSAAACPTPSLHPETPRRTSPSSTARSANPAFPTAAPAQAESAPAAPSPIPPAPARSASAPKKALPFCLVRPTRPPPQTSVPAIIMDTGVSPVPRKPLFLLAFIAATDRLPSKHHHPPQHRLRTEDLHHPRQGRRHRPPLTSPSTAKTSPASWKP